VILSALFTRGTKAKELMPGVSGEKKQELCPIYAPFSPMVNPSPEQGFFWGFQMIGGTRSFYPWMKADLESRLKQAVKDIRQVGAGWVRVYLIWADIEPVVRRENFINYLGRADYPRREEVSDEMVQDYAFNQGAWSGENALSWNQYDCLVKHMTDGGVGIFLNLALEDNWAMPREGASGKTLTPKLVGIEKYLGLVYLHSRAVVRRYLPRVQYYQLEDELNAGYLRGVIFYRVRRGRIWASEKFKEKLLKTLSDAVQEEGKKAGLKTYRMVYLHTFLSDPLVRTYAHYAVKWARYYDLVGLDIYPCSYTLGFIPQFSASISHQLNRTIRALEKAGYRVGKDKFVYVSETSFATRPWQRGFNEKNQAIAIQSAIEGKKFFGKGVLGTRASGFCWGALTGSEYSTLPWFLPGYNDSFMGIVKPDSPVRYTEAYYQLKQAIKNFPKRPLQLTKEKQ